MLPTIITQGVGYPQLLDDLRAIIRHEVNQAQATAAPAALPAEELLTIRQAAELLDVCVATVHQWRRRGVLIATKIGGRTYFRCSDLLTAGTREQRTVKPSRTKGKPAV